MWFSFPTRFEDIDEEIVVFEAKRKLILMSFSAYLVHFDYIPKKNLHY